jgi:hypothetical protein
MGFIWTSKHKAVRGTKKQPRCVRCGKNKPRHKGSTLCKTCYQHANMSKEKAKSIKFSKNRW